MDRSFSVVRRSNVQNVVNEFYDNKSHATVDAIFFRTITFILPLFIDDKCLL